MIENNHTHRENQKWTSSHSGESPFLAGADHSAIKKAHAPRIPKHQQAFQGQKLARSWVVILVTHHPATKQTVASKMGKVTWY